MQRYRHTKFHHNRLSRLVVNTYQKSYFRIYKRFGFFLILAITYVRVPMSLRNLRSSASLLTPKKIIATL